MPYTEPEIAVLKKYRIMLPDGSFRQTDLRRSIDNREPPGPGPLMSEDAVNRLLAADTTDDKQWLDWIFFQAAGGDAAKAQTNLVFEQLRDQFIRERTDGFTHPDSGIHYDGVPREQAEARWRAAESRFREAIAVSDQDLAGRLHTFGFFRDWPGEDDRYAHIVEAMEKYLKLYSKLLQMNKKFANSMDVEARIVGGEEPLPVSPEGIKTYQGMLEIAMKVERYFASKKARRDIRILGDKPVYDDPNITAIIPLTYAAAVEFGYDLWPWASRRGFEQTLAGKDRGFQDLWMSTVSHGNAIVYLAFKGPVPAWQTRQKGQWEVKDLTDLALDLGQVEARGNPDEWVVHDQENRRTLTIADVKQMILDEPARTDPAEEEEDLFARGKNVYSTSEDAQRVVNSLDRALQAVKAALADVSKIGIKPNVFSLD